MPTVKKKKEHFMKKIWKIKGFPSFYIIMDELGEQFDRSESAPLSINVKYGFLLRFLSCFI